MKYRICVTLWMLVLISLLFGSGMSYMIYRTYENAAEQAESETLTSTQSIMESLRLLSDNNEGFTEQDLSDCLESISSHMSLSSVLLCHDDDIIFQYGSKQLLLPEDLAVDDNMILVFFKRPKDDVYIGSSTSLTIGQKRYTLGTMSDLTYLYDMVNSQLTSFLLIFLVLIGVSSVILWLSSTKLIRPITLAAEAKDRFMGAFSHELKTPMTAMIGYSSLLKDKKLSGEKETEALNYIYSESKRLEHLSHALLSLFDIDKKEEEFVPFNIGDTANLAISSILPKIADSDISLERRINDGVYMGNKDLILMLIVNLLDNACKAMEQSGTISIDVLTFDDHYEIRVLDTGRGMDKDALRHITEAFYRVDKSRSRAQGGVGLGLTLCEKIVSVHGGELRFDSAPGKGCLVTVRINASKIQNIEREEADER